MNALQNNEWIEAGVYDTSRGASISNWQWGNVKFDESWEIAAALIHQGWPAEPRVIMDQQAVLLGVIRHSKFVWLYRVYPAGRDEHGRPGRYFFALARLLSLDGITHPQVAGLLTYFEKERGLPLNTKPLDDGWPDAEPNPILVRLRKNLQENSRLGHWGMDGAGRMIRLLDPEPAKKETDEVDTLTGRGKLVIGAGVFVASAIGYFLMNPSFSFNERMDESSTKTTPSPPPTTKTTSETPDPTATSKPVQTTVGVQVPSISTDPPREPIRKEEAPIDTDPSKKEKDELAPTNKTQKTSPQPPSQTSSNSQ